MSVSRAHWVRRVAALLPACLVVGVAGLALAAPEAGAVTCTRVGTALKAGQTLKRGQCITSANGQFTLVMQGDGNLVSYRNSDSRACFASGTAGRTDAIAEVRALSATATYPIEFVVTRQANPFNGYIGYAGYGGGHPASSLTVDVSSANGSLWVGYSEYYGIGSSGRRC